MIQKPKFLLDHSTHHLLSIKRLDESFNLLVRELALPQNKDISDEAQEKGTTFEECLGFIAARLDIVLDGLYDVADLCELLTKALKNRKEFGNRMHEVDKRLVSAEIVETAESIALQLGYRVIDNSEKIKSPSETVTTAKHVLFMNEHGCMICDDRKACRKADKCLADEGGGFKKPSGKELH